ncbi:cuticlin-4 isoform X2 [Helicoverpa zea]|nr:cuticlin-4 isoform X2 [Helicoverpa zea]
MHVTVSLSSTHGRNSIYDTFNGIVYPAGLGSNSSCLREYVSEKGDLHYTLPLRGCNTMSNDNEDGTVEYYNNIIVQPHLRLVTGQGRGYHVRCRYRRRDLTHFHLYRPRADRLTNSLADDFSSDHTSDEFDEDSGLLPSVSMKIYKGDPEDKQVASNVRIGDILSLVVSLEKQRQFGLLVSECSVRDGLGWAEQSLIADDGCPLDGEIMGQFQYSSDRQTARVSFPAHKFPYTASVYYTCEVKLCDLKHPTDCEPCSHKRRVRRDDEGSPATVELFKGLYVNEADSPDNDEVTSEKKEDEICISQKNFAMGICIAGVILMICVIAAIAYILARRRNPKTYSRTGSSLYSGPYTNTGYSHTS